MTPFFIYNTKQPHYDFPMVRITVQPEEKPLNMKASCWEPEMVGKFLTNSGLGKKSDKGLACGNTRFVHFRFCVHSKHVFLRTELTQKCHCSRNYTQKLFWTLIHLCMWKISLHHHLRCQGQLHKATFYILICSFFWEVLRFFFEWSRTTLLYL